MLLDLNTSDANGFVLVLLLVLTCFWLSPFMGFLLLMAVIFPFCDFLRLTATIFSQEIRFTSQAAGILLIQWPCGDGDIVGIDNFILFLFFFKGKNIGIRLRILRPW